MTLILCGTAMGIILGVDDEFHVVGCAKNGREALEFAQKEKPDVF
jgi:Response regulator containing CheY-like receiver domain and AraC-type DNA-binding domain